MAYLEFKRIPTLKNTARAVTVFILVSLYDNMSEPHKMDETEVVLDRRDRFAAPTLFITPCNSAVFNEKDAFPDIVEMDSTPIHQCVLRCFVLACLGVFVVQMCWFAEDGEEKM